VWVALALTSIKQWREAVLDSLRQVQYSGLQNRFLKLPPKMVERITGTTFAMK
jgi:hypothetical protein